MSRWLSDMAPRERAVVLAGGLALLVILLVTLVWMPLQDRRETLSARVVAQSDTLAWMLEARQRVASQRSGEAPAEPRDGRSLLALVDDTIREEGLADALRRAEPAGADGVRVWLESAPYVDVASWMDSLSGAHGLAVTEFSLDRAGNGRVNARLTVAESAGTRAP